MFFFFGGIWAELKLERKSRFGNRPILLRGFYFCFFPPDVSIVFYLGPAGGCKYGVTRGKAKRNSKK